MRSRNRLCWPCIATMAVALIAGAIGFAAIQLRPTHAAAATATPTPAHAYVDLSDRGTRRLLTNVAHSWRNHGADVPQTLFERCGADVEQTYAVTRQISFEKETYAELRQGNDGTWTALAWQNDDVAFSPPPPPPPPPPDSIGTTYTHKRPADSKRWEQTISGSEAEVFVREFDQLSQDGAAPLRGTLEVQDGGSLLVEGCVGGQYRVFFRANAADDDPRIKGLVNLLLAFAGVAQDDLRAHY